MSEQIISVDANYNEELEAIILSSLIFNNQNKSHKALSEHSFHHDFHKKIFNIIDKLSTSGVEVEFQLVNNELKKSKDYTEQQSDYIRDLAISVPRDVYSQVQILNQMSLERATAHDVNSLFANTNGFEDGEAEKILETILDRSKQRRDKLIGQDYAAVDITTLIGTPPPRHQYTIENFIYKTGVHLFSGAGSAGKSLMTLQMMYCVVSGIKFAGHKSTLGDCLFITSGEDSVDELHRRIDSVSRHYGDLPKKKIEVIKVSDFFNETEYTGKTVKITQSTAFKRVMDQINDANYKMIVVDNLAQFFNGNEIVRSEVAAFMRIMDIMAENTAVILLAHTSKSDKGTASGSTAFENSVRAHFNLSVDKEDTNMRQLEIVKGNYSPKGIKDKFQWNDGAFEWLDYSDENIMNLVKEDFIRLLYLAIEAKVSLKQTKHYKTVYAPQWAKEHATSRHNQELYEKAMRELINDGKVNDDVFVFKNSQRQRVLSLAPAEYSYNDYDTTIESALND